MAMSDDEDPVPGDDVLALAAARLRAHTDEGWGRTRVNALDRLRDVVRGGPPVDGLHREGGYVVSAPVLRTVVGAAADAGGALPTRVDIAATDGRIDAVTVRLAVPYGVPVEPVARRARALVRAELVRVLGEPGERGSIDVEVVDVYR